MAFLVLFVGIFLHNQHVLSNRWQQKWFGRGAHLEPWFRYWESRRASPHRCPAAGGTSPGVCLDPTSFSPAFQSTSEIHFSPKLPLNMLFCKARCWFCEGFWFLFHHAGDDSDSPSPPFWKFICLHDVFQEISVRIPPTCHLLGWIPPLDAGMQILHFSNSVGTSW